MFYLYKISDGTLVSNSALPIDPPAGMAVKELEPPTGGEIWDAATQAFVEAPPSEDGLIGTRLERIDFLRLFTVPERIAIRTAAKSDPIIEDFMDILGAANAVWTGNLDTIAGVQYMASQGIITPARAAEVLSV